MPKTLAGRITLLFLVLLMVLSVSQYITLVTLWNRADREMRQRIEWGLAGRIVTQVEPYAKSDDQKLLLQNALGRVGFTNPRINIYVLDGEGWVIPMYAPSDRIFESATSRTPSTQVPVALLEEFLQSNPDRSLPLLGPSITFSDKETIFSAAHFPIAGRPGYLYVTLEGHQWTLARRGTEAVYVLFGGAITSFFIFLIIGSLGLCILFFATQRFRRLTKAVSRIADGDLSARAASGPDDEIGRLSAGINTMADRLVETIKSLEQQDEFRRNFIANITHDLRTPITAIQGYLQRFEKKQDSIEPEKRREYFSVLKRNTERLDSYVEELFEASKVDASERQLELSEFSIDSLLTDDVVLSMVPQAEQKSIVLTTDCAAPGVLVRADRNMIQRVIMNLLQNAVRYTEEGGSVCVSTRRSADSVEVRVEDTGIGIAENDIPQLFAPFFRAEKSRSLENGGTGLGLFIVKQILDAHETEILVESSLAQGTSFRFNLPIVVEMAQTEGSR